MSKIDTQRPRLGRGLSSLINISDLPVETTVTPSAAPAVAVDPRPGPEVGRANPGTPPTAATDTIVALPIDSIVPNPHQPRREMAEQALKDLSASIKSTGLIQPIVVRRTADGQIQLIAGERRWRAAKLAGLTVIPAILRDVDVYTQAQMALIENIQREDLNPIDRAAGYQALIDQLGLTQAELAGRLAENASVIANHLRLLSLAEPIQEMVKAGALSMGHCKLLAGVIDLAEQQRLAQLCVAQALSVRNLENLMIAKSLPAGKSRRAGEVPTPLHLVDLEKNIARQLGMRLRVRTSKSKKRGSLLIHYGSLDQFDELMARLGVKLD